MRVVGRADAVALTPGSRETVSPGTVLDRPIDFLASLGVDHREVLSLLERELHLDHVMGLVAEKTGSFVLS
jgi:hypothetical protein